MCVRDGWVSDGWMGVYWRWMTMDELTMGGGVDGWVGAG